MKKNLLQTLGLFAAFITFSAQGCGTSINDRISELNDLFEREVAEFDDFQHLVQDSTASSNANWDELGISAIVWSETVQLINKKLGLLVDKLYLLDSDDRYSYKPALLGMIDKYDAFLNRNADLVVVAEPWNAPVLSHALDLALKAIEHHTTPNEVRDSAAEHYGALYGGTNPSTDWRIETTLDPNSDNLNRRITDSWEAEYNLICRGTGLKQTCHLTSGALVGLKSHYGYFLQYFDFNSGVDVGLTTPDARVVRFETMSGDGHIKYGEPLSLKIEGRGYLQRLDVAGSLPDFILTNSRIIDWEIHPIWEFMNGTLNNDGTRKLNGYEVDGRFTFALWNRTERAYLVHCPRENPQGLSWFRGNVDSLDTD
ncbi:MAG TPA: hypothetical protein PLH57_09995, partial [Oligoflexia bacterium]|nr:hypothetical protein [Oligoflexia bacterium]